jgi:glucose/mannose transport system substrate-binding protein
MHIYIDSDTLPNISWWTAFALILVCTLSRAAGADSQPKVSAEVIHWWTSKSEAAAVKLIANAFNLAGGQWIDSPVGGVEDARAVFTFRLLGRQPPTAALYAPIYQLKELVKGNLLNNIDEIANQQHWDKILPPVILNSIKIDGHFYAVPVEIHNPAWIWYSKNALARSGILTEPNSFAEFLSDLNRLKDNKVIPLAYGGENWQALILFYSILINSGGKDLYLKILRDHDIHAILSDEFIDVIDKFKKLRHFIDKGSPGRNWTDTTNLLITDKAGFQIMGDWAKGEMLLAGKTVGKDFGCIANFGGKSQSYIVQADYFVFPRNEDVNVIKAQKLLASIILSPKLQLEFSKIKGSIPARFGIDASTLDICAKYGAKLLQLHPELAIGSVDDYLSSEQAGELGEFLGILWSRDISSKLATEKIRSILSR